MPEYYGHEKLPQKPQTCPTVGVQTAMVCLPVTINPFSVTGQAKVQCCGEPVIVSSCDHCRGKVNGSCEFTITQKLRVELPVEFGATVCVGDTYVECGCAKEEEPEKDCGCRRE